ncbi:MAG: hypothetical protein QE276_05590 [Cyanobium sp. D14.bin.5]|jgi:hypothetical protein|nr:hypothetical protein [Cyanobium sp. D14.bin.5]
MILGLGWLLANSAQALQRPVDPVAVCVVTPRVEPVTEGDAIGLVPTPMPLLVVVEPLLELRIERHGLLVWQQLAPAGRPFRAPLAWPLAPIAPGEVVLLRLRPEQAAEGSFAQVQLVGADAERMARTAALILSLGQSPPAWLAAIETALEAGDVSLAWALLFEPQLPDAGDLAALRNEVVRRGCGD